MRQQSAIQIDAARAEFARFVADGRIASECVGARMAVDAHQIHLLHFHSSKLILHASGEMSGASEHLNAGGVGVEAMGGTKFLR